MDYRNSIGIDLGTSNSAIALASSDSGEITMLPIIQVTGANAFGDKSGLPSAAYLPHPQEFEAGAFDLPEKSGAGPFLLGRFAREHGAQVPDRLVISAKSWLCNSHIDHRQPILPWGSESAETKISPFDASRLYLEHLRYAFEYHAAQTGSEATLENTRVVVTVPASFDEVARSLTAEAAEAAGFENVLLMEEPQAAFYSWLAERGSDWRKQVRPGDIILVCDVGGGTSDFSLIAVSEKDGALELERLSVGEHILLGGDNLDLALAHVLRHQLESEGRTIDEWQFLALNHAARQAKETLFGDLDLEEVPVAVPSRGSSLFAGSVETRLRRETLYQIALEGFLPLSSVTDMPQKGQSAGLQEFGLPFESDPVLSKHLARFLARSFDNVRANSELAARLDASVFGDNFIKPTAVLFNGGFFNAAPARERVLELLQQWCGGERVRELTGTRFDLAVAHGAASYGLKRITGSGIRVKAGASRSYYIGVETSGLAIPGFKPPLKALCVVPQGMEEGTEAVLDAREFGLVIGEEVTFRFFSSTVRSGDAVGTVVANAERELEETSELKTLLDAPEGLSAGDLIPVKLHTRVTEVGTLDLWIQHTRSEQRWKLEFTVRTD